LKIEAHIINAFVDGNLGGNPAGVVLNADDLSNSQKLEIAATIVLSETAFVSSSKVAGFKLDFFTPTKQIAHCGHATIATFVYLRDLGLITKSRTSKETIDGNREIFFDGDMAFMEQLAPSYKEIDHCIDDICSSLGISTENLLNNHNPFIVNTGNSFLIVPLNGLMRASAEWLMRLNELHAVFFGQRFELVEIHGRVARQFRQFIEEPLESGRRDEHQHLRRTFSQGGKGMGHAARSNTEPSRLGPLGLVSNQEIEHTIQYAPRFIFAGMDVRRWPHPWLERHFEQ